MDAFFILLLPLAVFFIIIGVLLIPKNEKHKTLRTKFSKPRSLSYKQASGNGFFKTLFDKGAYGEYKTYSYLEALKGHHRLLTNLYIPNKNGKTTEVDLIMLSETGIYVFESKNYSGWIFGDEKNKNWTQTFPNQKKYRFFNPIWQNRGHVNALKYVLDLEEEELFKSYIVFSERCVLKKINVTSPDVKVMKRDELLLTIKKEIVSSYNLLSIEQIEELYTKLKPYTMVDQSVKEAHIQDIQNKKRF